MSTVGVPLLSPGNKGFDSAFKDTSLEEDPALASEAFNAYISPEPYYLPLIAAAGVLFLEADHIAQLYLHDHFHCLNWLLYRGR